MAQISRPFQIALLALLALAMLMVTWFMLLHRSSGTASSGTSSPSVAVSAGSSASHAATHASAFGAGRVSRTGSASARPAATVHTHRAATTVHAHHASATVHTSHAAATVHAHHASATVHTSHASVTAHTHHGAATARSHAPAHGSDATATATATAALTLHNLTAAVHLNAVVNLVEAIDPALGLKGKIAHAEGVFIARMKADLQPVSPAAIAAELHQGKIVLLLFLNPHAYDDDATAIGTTEVAHKLRHHVAAHLALADQVNSFGSITRDVQVYQTPTLLIINPKREVATITGLTDEFSLEQAIAEAKG